MNRMCVECLDFGVENEAGGKKFWFCQNCRKEILDAEPDTQDLPYMPPFEDDGGFLSDQLQSDMVNNRPFTASYEQLQQWAKSASNWREFMISSIQEFEEQDKKTQPAQIDPYTRNLTSKMYWPF